MAEKIYKIVFIDWYATLSHSIFWGHWRQEGHVYSSHLPKIQSLWLNELAPVLVPWMRGELTAEEFVALVAPHIPIDHDTLLSEFIFSCRNMRLVSERIPSLVRQLQQQGCKVVVATDNMDCFSRWTVPALGLNLLFDDILNSHSLRCIKEDLDNNGHSMFFSSYLMQHNVAAEDCVLIDDSNQLGAIVSQMGMPYRHITQRDGLVVELEDLLTSGKKYENTVRSLPNAPPRS
jgi:hypothetical protein